MTTKGVQEKRLRENERGVRGREGRERDRERKRTHFFSPKVIAESALQVQLENEESKSAKTLLLQHQQE